MTKPPATPAGSPARPEGEPLPTHTRPAVEKPLVSPVQRRGQGEPTFNTVLTPISDAPQPPSEDKPNISGVPISDIDINTARVQELIAKGKLKRDYESQGRSFTINHAQARILGHKHPRGDTTAISVKGLPDETPYVRYMRGEVDNFRIERVVTSGELEGAGERLEFLRSHGLPTETYVSLHPLTEVPARDPSYKYHEALNRSESSRRATTVPQGMSVTEWKDQVLEQLEYRKTHTDDEYREAFDHRLLHWSQMDPDDIALVEERIRNNDLYVVLRTQPVAESFVDLQTKKTLADTQPVLERVFAAVNTHRNGLHTPEGGFDINNIDHIKAYFTDFVPVNMGDYLAKLHNEVVVYGWAHGQNWKLDVTLADPSSIKGIPFGDPAPTPNEKRYDIQRSIEAIDMLLNLTTMGGYHLKSKEDSYVAKQFLMNDELRVQIETERFYLLNLKDADALDDRIANMRKEMVCRFLATYLHQRGGLRPSRMEDQVRGFLVNLDLQRGDLNPTSFEYETRIMEMLREGLNS